MHDQFGGVGDLRRAHQLLAAYATGDVAAMNAVWREATAQMATVDLAAALVAACFVVAPELLDRVYEFRAAATDFAALEAEVAADG